MEIGVDVDISDVDVGDDINTSDVSADIPEDVPEDFGEDIGDEIPAETSDFDDDIPEALPEDVLMDEFANMGNSISEVLPEDASAGEIDDLGSNIPEDVPEDTLVGETDDLSGNISEKVPEDKKLDETGNLNSDIPEDIMETSETIKSPGVGSESVYDDIPEDIQIGEEGVQGGLEITDSGNELDLEDDEHYHAIPNSERDIEAEVKPYHAIPTSENVDTFDSSENDGSSETELFADDTEDQIFVEHEPDEYSIESLNTQAQIDTSIQGSEANTSDYIQPPEEQFSDKIDEIINNENLTVEQKKDLLLDIRSQLEEGQIAQSEIEGDILPEIGDESGPVLTLKRDELSLLDQGHRNIQDLLEARADNYRDLGYPEDEIASTLANDKVALREEFLRDAFPGQDISPDIFNFFDDTAVPGNSQLSDIQSVSDVSDWIGDINPNFDAFDPESPYCNNCGSCAYAVYQRLEGLSVDSCASAENIGYNSEMTALTGMEQVSMSPDEIQEQLLSQGDGAHAIIGIDRAEGPGHWFNAACIDGKVVAIDGQTGEITDWPPDYGDVVNWEMSIKKGA